METVFFISDLHFGHKNILGFTQPPRTGKDYVENALNICRNWERVVTKRDLVWVLGDICFDPDFLTYFESLPGRKKLVMGNHDVHLNQEHLLRIFEGIYGLVKYKKFFLSHAPIHPSELRGKVNIHGHVHCHTLDDPRYFNVCVENINETPISLEQIKERIELSNFVDV